MSQASKWIVIGLYALIIGSIVFQFSSNKRHQKQLLKIDSTNTANFQKLDSTRSIIEVRTVTRTIKLKQNDAKDDKIDKEQDRLLDSLMFDPDKLPNF